MRVLILAASAALVLTGTANAAQHHRYHHHATATAAPAADGAIPADVLSPHELVVRNLHDSGYNPATDTAH